MTITSKALRDLFEYSNGHLIWKKDMGSNKTKGKIAGTDTDRYKVVCVDSKKYYLHRLVYLYHNGYLPRYVDHKDGDTKNNIIENLRPCTSSQNSQNRKLGKTNTTGFKNVSFNSKLKKYKVELRVDGVFKTLGYFDDVELADLVAQEARSKYHKEFAREN